MDRGTLESVVRQGDLVGVIEAAYRLDASESEWLGGLLDASKSCFEGGLGSLAFFYDARRYPPRVYGAQERDASTAIAEAAAATIAGLSNEYLDHVARKLYVGTGSEVPGFDEQPIVKEVMHPNGAFDSININAYDPSGIGVWVGAPQPRVTKLSERRRAVLTRVGVHMATGLGLRARLAKSQVAAVLTPGGRVEHAQGDAELKAAREALREAAIAVDRARGKLRREAPDDAVGMWRARVSAQWTLVDQFESDGKRFVVARTNALPLESTDLLTAREQEVLALLMQGHSNKLIAYELGITASTVRVLAARATDKLGASSTTDAVERYRRLTSRA
jgi:DNA-binding CsgD family transcriptional regulator